MKKAAFLDRDGVINKKRPEGEYVTRWEEFEFLSGVGEAIAQLTNAGFGVIVVSNQRCVAKGLMTLPGLQSIHRQMCRELETQGATITAGYYCPHDLQPACDCRKPAPGLLLQAAREHDIDLRGSWMIGDSEIDIQAGKMAGCQTVRILSTEADKTSADIVAKSLLHGVRQILQTNPRVRRLIG